jgi:PAS domain S-box-containing protein
MLRKGSTPFYAHLAGLPVYDSQGQIIQVKIAVNDVTEDRRAIETVLLQARMLDSVGESVIATDPDLKIIFWNKAAENIYGWKPHEVLGRNIDEIVVPSISARVESQLLKGEAWSGEFTVHRRDGTLFPAMLHNSPLFDDTGKLIGVVGTSWDITERKQAEMREKEYVEDLIALSQAATALVELPPEEDIFQIIAKNLRQLTRDNIYIIVTSYDENTNMSRVRAFVGPPEIEKLFDIKHSYVMGFSWQGKLYGSVIILVSKGTKIHNPDIIETFVEQSAIALQRKQAQDDLARAKDELEKKVAERTAELTEVNANLKIEINIRRQVEEELRKSERFNASLLDNAPNPIVVFNARKNILFVNQALEELTGFSAGDVIGIGPPFPWWPSEKTDQYLRQFPSNRLQPIHQDQIIFRKKNGEPFWVEIAFSTLKGASKEDSMLIAIWLDITEQKKAEAQLLAYQKELRSLVSRSTLTEQDERRKIANLIHDGVTQLLALCAMKMEVLMESTEDPGVSTTLNEIYKVIQQSIEDTRTLTFELSPPSLYDLGLEAALGELAERFEDQRRLTVDYDDDGRPKPLDDSTSILLFQAVRELLHNIFRYANARSVHIYSRKVHNNINIIVRDDGTGFNPQDLKPDRRNGLKFGLFSIQERFRYIGGHLQIETKPGKGSSFTLIAPLKKK